ncbi:MAG: 2-oxoacid:ferredoxin oxidoreductase subunit beta [Bacteroidales bacterium]|nr:2-oxoacid:ferredoxin oxidoreductase subunit beta [Bacteroidales bacterium]
MTATYTAKDLKSSSEVKWCAGCGDHAILNALQKAMPEIGVNHEDLVVVSGIGSSRLPYYMETYGMHTIHGRASAIASGVKTANPKLHVWQITGDGDCLAIGGNHFIHTVRRNIDLNIILFNNQIYGLTKGQYSPTTKKGQITKSSPHGTIENPFNPGELTIGAQGTFFARTTDNNIPQMTEVMKEAALFKGTSVVEILQNCIIFNNATHEYVTNRDTRNDRQIFLEHGKPMLFGEKNDKGLVLKGLSLKVVNLGKNGITEADILVHDATTPDTTLHTMLANMKSPYLPVAMGVIRKVKADTYESLLEKQIETAKKESEIKTLNDLFYGGDTWEVK